MAVFNRPLVLLMHHFNSTTLNCLSEVTLTCVIDNIQESNLMLGSKTKLQLFKKEHLTYLSYFNRQNFSTKNML